MHKGVQDDYDARATKSELPVCALFIPIHLQGNWKKLMHWLEAQYCVYNRLTTYPIITYIH